MDKAVSTATRQETDATPKSYMPPLQSPEHETTSRTLTAVGWLQVSVTWSRQQALRTAGPWASCKAPTWLCPATKGGACCAHFLKHCSWAAHWCCRSGGWWGRVSHQPVPSDAHAKAMHGAWTPFSAPALVAAALTTIPRMGTPGSIGVKTPSSGIQTPVAFIPLALHILPAVHPKQLRLMQRLQLLVLFSRMVAAAAALHVAW